MSTSVPSWLVFGTLFLLNFSICKYEFSYLFVFFLFVSLVWGKNFPPKLGGLFFFFLIFFLALTFLQFSSRDSKQLWCFSELSAGLLDPGTCKERDCHLNITSHPSLLLTCKQFLLLLFYMLSRWPCWSKPWGSSFFKKLLVFLASYFDSLVPDSTKQHLFS